MIEVFDIEKMLEYFSEKCDGQMSAGFIHTRFTEEGSKKEHDGVILRAVDISDPTTSLVTMLLKDCELVSMEGLQVYPIDYDWVPYVYDAKLPYKIVLKVTDMMREENGITTTYSGETQITLEGPLAAKFMIMYMNEKMEYSLDTIFPDGDGSKFVTPTDEDKLAVWYRQITLSKGEALKGLSFVPCNKNGETVEAGKNFGFRPKIESDCPMTSMTVADLEDMVNEYKNNIKAETRVVSKTGKTDEVLMEAFLNWRKATYDNRQLSPADRKKEVEKIPNYMCLKYIAQAIAKGKQPNFD